jgi:monoamine oxidase
MQPGVIIIGGGAAGLMAAYELAGKFDVTIIEARDQLGGRIRSQPTGQSYTIEEGAEFVHGNPPITLSLLKEAGIEPVRVEGNMYRKENGRWVERNDFIEGWDVFFKKAEALKQDCTLGSFLDEFYRGDKYAALRRQITGYAEGFDVADVDKVSLKSLIEEWSAMEEDNYRVPGGYARLITYLEQQCRDKGVEIETGETVKLIDWEIDGVTVYTQYRPVSGEKLIITVPVSILQASPGAGSISFSPAIDAHLEASKNIGFGSVIKVIIHFSKALWKADTGFLFSDEEIPVWWTQLPDTAPILTGWIGGGKAAAMKDLGDDDILEKAITSLASIFSTSADDIREMTIASYVFNWYNVPESLGAYSYPTPQTKAAQEFLLQPLADTIYFAGEAVYAGEHPGTVEAALASGKAAAQKIMAQVKTEKK